MAAQGGVRFGGLALSRDRDGRALVWFSAIDGGRNAVWVTRADGVPRRIRAVTSARSRVNEYGGGAFWAHGESLFWVEDDDQRIRRVDLGDDDGCLVDRGIVDRGIVDRGIVDRGVGAAPGQEIAEGSDLLVEHTGAGAELVDEPPAHRSIRYAAGVVEPGGAWMVTERELHMDPTGTSDRGAGPNPGPGSNTAAVSSPQVVNDLVWLPTGLADSHPTSSLPSGVHSIVAGSDFTVAPALSPDGRHLAWLRWDHPDMPWDAAEVWAAELIVGADGPVVRNARRVAGGAGGRATGDGGPAVSACLPKWDPDGRLWWCDDRDDLWLLRKAPDPGPPPQGAGDAAPAILADGAEARDPGGVGIGEVGVPRWVSGGSRFGFADGGAIMVETVDGLDRIASVTDHGTVTGSGAARVTGSGVDTEGIVASPGWVDILLVGPTVAGARDHRSLLVAVAGSPTEPTAVTCRILGSGAAGTSRFHERPWPLPSASISVPEPITFATGESRDQVSHALFHPPQLEGVSGRPGELPPLVVRIHGGPTANARAELSSSVQFWTTRGFAVVEVNYRGSSGYGRAYRDQLRGGWGEVEVQDCIAAAEHLASRRRVDAQRCVIRGGSAGGFTALEAVAAEPTASGFRFAAATTLYGVTDLMALASDTHKFESRYLDGLIGPLPEAESVYRRRSPLDHPERIASPVLILQGLEDPVVPPSQAEVLVAALDEAGIDHEYRTYEGEGHGFRNEATIVDALETELAFYQRVLGLTTAS